MQWTIPHSSPKSQPVSRTTSRRSTPIALPRFPSVMHSLVSSSGLTARCMHSLLAPRSRSFSSHASNSSNRKAVETGDTPIWKLGHLVRAPYWQPWIGSRLEPTELQSRSGAKPTNSLERKKVYALWSQRCMHSIAIRASCTALTPNHAVKPTRSGLRPPHAAYLYRWAPRFRRVSAASGAISSRAARSAHNALMPYPASPCMSSKEWCSFRRAPATQSTFAVHVGCPSFGGQRTDVVLPRKQVTRMNTPHGHATFTQNKAGRSAAGASRSAR